MLRRIHSKSEWDDEVGEKIKVDRKVKSGGRKKNEKGLGGMN